MRISVAVSDNDYTRPLIDGRVGIEGVTADVSVLHPSEMFWRQLKFRDFDVSEMSLASLAIATARGDATWFPIPVFTSREFFHTRALIRTDRGIETPADLAGRRVGVPEYQQTAAVWARGALATEWGVHPGDVEWFMERDPSRSHGSATGFVAPAGVRVAYLEGGQNLGSMLVDGELDALLLYLNQPNLVDRSRIDLTATPMIRPMFADPVAEGLRYYAATGLLPANHCVVVRTEVAERFPWLPLNILGAFAQAQDVAAAALAAGLARYQRVGASLDLQALRRPFAYGLAAQRATVDALLQFLFDQGLVERRLAAADLFRGAMSQT